MLKTIDRSERFKRLSPAKKALLLKALQEEAAHREKSKGIPPRSWKGPSPLSFAQQRLWFIEQLQPGTPLYNVARAVRIVGSINVAALEQGFNEIVLCWPRPEFEGGQALEKARLNLVESKFPDFYPIFGEIHSFTASDARQVSTTSATVQVESPLVEVA